MSHRACVLVRIAVVVPPPPKVDGEDITLCPFDDHVCRRPQSDAPVAAGITVEMIAFYREHPDSN